MSKKITAVINSNTGALSITTDGYSGGECLEATKALETGLGMDQGCAIPTAEMYKQPEEKEKEIGG